jgi:hypothetical protein
MHDIEIEFRYLANTLAPDTIANLTDSREPDEKSNYANFTIDKGVKLRSKKSPLRVRLYDATSADVVHVLNENSSGRLALLRQLAASTRRELEFTLKVPTVKGKGRGELQHFVAIAKQLNLGKNLYSVEKFDEALCSARLSICGAVYTERSQWNLGKLTNHSSLVVTRDASRCHHQLNGKAREIIEVEALVSLDGEPSKSQITEATSEADAALKQWIKSKLGFLPESVIGTAGACIIAHDTELAREMVAQEAIKFATLVQMVRNQELSEAMRRAIIS